MRTPGGHFTPNLPEPNFVVKDIIPFPEYDRTMVRFEALPGSPCDQTLAWNFFGEVPFKLGDFVHLTPIHHAD